MTYFCYILECSDGTLYTGWTVNVEKRLIQHNKGLGARYTRTRLPVKVVYVEEQPDKITALKRERAIKALPRKKKLELFTHFQARLKLHHSF
jgi:putative endonuclease